MSVEIPLLLFAKAPIAGRVKTRLQRHCTPEQAAEIAKILLQESLRKVTQVWPGPVSLTVWLDQDHPFLLEMAAKYNVTLSLQAAGDLGAKMHSALQQFGYPAAVMGCDAPHVTDASLLQAYTSLSAGESVLGPSRDGGYYLIGLSESMPSLFTNMAWGTDTVLRETLDRVNQTTLTMRQLAALQDVDEWPDVLGVADQLPELNRYLSKELLK